MADLIVRERLAAQIVAVMQADFSRPGPDEMREILKAAEGQIRAISPQPSPDAPPSSGALLQFRASPPSRLRSSK
jgi:hypothetical protein